MKFGYSILYVEDVPKTLDFYQKAFGFGTKFLDTEGGDFGELETGTTSLAFCSWRFLKSSGTNPRAPDPRAPSSEIAFVTLDVPATLARALAAGATLVQEVEPMPWGQTTACVSDLNGFLVELCTPMCTPMACGNGF